MLFGRDDVGLVVSVFGGGGGEMFAVSVFEGIFSTSGFSTVSVREDTDRDSEVGGFSVGTVSVREDTDRGSGAAETVASDSNSIFFLIQLSL